MKHLVTGGTGFLGNLIAKELLKKGNKVRILDINDDPTRDKQIEFFKADILDRDSVAKAMQGVDIVHHNVALVPLTKSGNKFSEVNYQGSKIAAEEAAKAGASAFIHMSSSAIYGIPPKGLINTYTPLNPVEIYGKSKLKAEEAVVEVCKKTKLPLISIRPRTILGEGRLGIFQILFDWIQSNSNIYVIGSGNINFQFVHALDLMSCYMLILDQQKEGLYNVGTDRYNTLRQDLESLIKYANSTSKVRSLPDTLTINTLKVLDHLNLSPLAPWHYLTYHKAFEFDVQPLLDIGWKPKYSNIQMFKESYSWFLENVEEVMAKKENLSIHRNPVAGKILNVLKKIS